MFAAKTGRRDLAYGLTDPATKLRGLSRYAIAIASVGLAFAARLAMDPLMGDRQPFTLFYVSIVFAT